MPVSCTNGDCSRAKQLITNVINQTKEPKTTTTTNKSATTTNKPTNNSRTKTVDLRTIDFDNLTVRAQKVFDRRVNGRVRKYENVITTCNVDQLFGIATDRLDTQACGMQHTVHVQNALDIVNEIFGEYSADDGTVLKLSAQEIDT